MPRQPREFSESSMFVQEIILFLILTSLNQTRNKQQN